MTEKKAVFGLIPFYVDPKAINYQKLVKAQNQTVEAFSKIVDVVVSVSDGNRLSDFPGYYTIHSPKNRGKADAVRKGFRFIERYDNIKPTFIIQTDADLDQDPNDACLFLEFFKKNSISPKDDVMVIGDRYHQNQVGTSEHRQAMVMFQNAFCLALGYDVRDPMSGFRGYTSSFARKFLDVSKSQRYGIEIEQIVISRLINAKIYTIPLSYSRERDSFTLSNKLLQSIDAILLHKNALKRRGLIKTVTAFETMRQNFLNEVKYIFDPATLDGKQLDIRKILFQPKDGKHSLKILD